MTSRCARVLGAFIGFAASSCLLDPDRPFTVSGRLRSDFGCYFLMDDRNYELYNWEDPVPPLGSHVTLRVRPIRDAVSACMVGEIVDVLAIVDVRTDFRTAAVVGEETWGRDDEIVLGQVEVMPGATLTVLPGTQIQIIPEGELHVRGRILMEGVPGDSVRIDGILSPGNGRLYPGQVVFDSVAAGSRVRFVTTPAGFQVHGDGPVLESIQGGISVARGAATIRDCYLSGVSTTDASVEIENSHVEHAIWGVHTSFTLENNLLAGLFLSYSRAVAHENVFRGRLSNFLFHGPSGGTFEHNTFEADSTHIEVRHDSDPVFHKNNFVGPAMTVDCSTYPGQPCIQLAHNWWGTTDEEAIRPHFHGPCDFCYSPWLTGPVEW